MRDVGVVGRRRVVVGIEHEAEEVERLRRRGADSGSCLADAAGEHDGVHAPEACEHLPDRPAQPVDVDVEGKLRPWVAAFAPGEHVA